MNVTVNSQDTMIGRGMDPKPFVLDFCKPQCIYWKEKLERCESKLEIVIKTNPTKTCLYPMRDWVTCVEACVSLRHFICPIQDVSAFIQQFIYCDSLSFHYFLGAT